MKIYTHSEELNAEQMPKMLVCTCQDNEQVSYLLLCTTARPAMVGPGTIVLFRIFLALSKTGNISSWEVS